MNLTKGINVGPRTGTRSGQFLLACLAALALTAAIGANPLQGDSETAWAGLETPPVAAPVQPAEPSGELSRPQPGLVPDYFEGGYRQPANLRERLQAERGELERTYP